MLLEQRTQYYHSLTASLFSWRMLECRFYFGGNKQYIIFNLKKIIQTEYKHRKTGKNFALFFRILRAECWEIHRKLLQYNNIQRYLDIQRCSKVSCERLNHFSWFEYVASKMSEKLSLPKVITVLLSWDPNIFRP